MSAAPARNNATECHERSAREWLDAWEAMPIEQRKGLAETIDLDLETGKMTAAMCPPKDVNDVRCKVNNVLDSYTDIEIDVKTLEGPWQTQTPQASSPKAEGRQQWPFFWSQEADATASAEYVIDGQIHAGTVGAIYGPSGTLKTMMGLDITACVVQEKEWRGMKTRKGGVIYVAAEGRGGIGRRIAGLHAEHPGIPDNSIATFTRAVQLLDAAALDDFAAQLIDEVLPVMPAPLRLIFFDTYSQSTAGGRENDADSFALAETNVRTLVARIGDHQDGSEPAGCLIHHTGKDSSRGPRGSSAMFDNLDWLLETAYAVPESEAKKIPFEDRQFGMTSVKVKDGLDGVFFPYKGALVEVGIREEDQRPIFAPVVRSITKEEVVEMQRADSKWKGLSSRDKILYECMADLFKKKCGVPIPTSVKISNPGGFSVGQTCLSDEMLRDEFCSQIPEESDTPDKTRAAKLKAYKRSLRNLHSRKIIKHFDGWIWDL